MLLIITGGATITPEDEPQPVDDFGSYRQALIKPKRKRFLFKPRQILPVTAIDTVIPVEPTDSCPISAGDFFHSALGVGYPLLRSIGDGALFLPTTSERHINWAQVNGAVLNRVSSGFGWPTYDCTGYPTVTFTYGGAASDPAAANFPATTPLIPGLSVGPSGTDQALMTYDGANEVFHDFWKVNMTAKTAMSHHANSARQEGLSPRGTSASGLLPLSHMIRRIDWIGSGRPTHALGIAVGSKTDPPYNHPIAVLSTEIVYPATFRDSSGGLNKGKNPYGTWLALPPGITKAAIGIVDTPNMMQHKMFDVSRGHGWVLVDQAKSSAAVFRADQDWTDAEVSEFTTAANKIRPFLRIISNVGASGSNPIGGGRPITYVCGVNRRTPDVWSINKWEAQYDFNKDLKDVTVTDKRGWDDSWKHYEVAYSVGGNIRMWQATRKTKYLDRALLYINGVVDAARISSSLDRSTFKDTYLGWLGLTHPSGVVNEFPLYEFYFWRWVAILLKDIKSVSLGTSYTDQFDEIRDFFETHVWRKWIARGANSYVYRTVSHISAHAGIIARYFSEDGSTAAIRSQALGILNNIDHLGQPTFGGPYNNIKAIIRDHPWATKPSETMYFNTYFQDPPPPATVPNYDLKGGPNECGSDTSHGEATILYIIDMLENGYGEWNKGHIAKAVNLWTVVWPDATTHYNWFRGPTAPVTPLKWTPNYNEIAGVAGYDRNMQVRYQGVTNSRQALYYGQGAYNSWKLGVG